MSSNGEDDDTDDLEALRKAALESIRPKVRPIEQVIGSVSAVSRSQEPAWSEVPASVDYPGFVDPVPEPSPFPVPQDVLAPMISLPRPAHPAWRSHFVNGVPDTRYKFPGFQANRRPYQSRTSHRSFGDRGRPLYDRGRGPRRGYIPDRGRGVYPTVNRSHDMPERGTPGIVPASMNVVPPVVDPLIPTGGNLIVIQPQKSATPTGSLPQVIKIVDNGSTDSTAKQINKTLDPSTSNNAQKPKLSLPQDKYCSSKDQNVKDDQDHQSSLLETVKKTKDKFSRYDKSESEDEDDSDDHSDIDDIAEEIDKFLNDVDIVDETVENELTSQDKTHTTAVENITNSEADADDQDKDDDNIDSLQNSPAPSEGESLDLDALANGDPVIGDFDDLDFLVDKEPSEECVSDTVKVLASGDADGALDSKKLRDEVSNSPILSTSSPSSITYTEGKDLSDSKPVTDALSSKTTSNDIHGVHAHKSPSPLSKASSVRDVGDRSPHNTSPFRSRSPFSSRNRSRSPNRQRSRYRSRSPFFSRVHSKSRSPFNRRSPHRLTHKRGSFSPRRSPVPSHRSPYRGRSPNQKSLSPTRRPSNSSLSPRRISSPLKVSVPQRRNFYAQRSQSPQGRQRPPRRRSTSPYGNRMNSHRDNSRNRRDIYSSYNEKFQGRSLSPSSKSNDRGRWQTSTGERSQDQKGGREDQAHHRSRDVVSGEKMSKLEDPANNIFMDEKELEKLSPEERAKIEARRKKFLSKEEIKVEDAKKTVSLKSIKERTKKQKKNDKKKEEPLDLPLDKGVVKKPEKGGISLKALRKKSKQKKIKQNANDSSEEDVTKSTLADLDEESEDSDSGRAWRLEENKGVPKKSVSTDSYQQNRRFDESSRTRLKFDRSRDRPRESNSTLLKDRFPKSQKDFHKRHPAPIEDNSDDNIPSNRLGSSVVASSHFKTDIPPEKLKIQIQVSQKEKKKKKSKSKLDFSQIYYVPAKRNHSSDNGDEVEDDDEEELSSVPKKKKKKEKKDKDKKEKKMKKLSTNVDNDDDKALPDEISIQKSRPSILERLGKKVELDEVKEKKRKKKKSKHLDNEEKDDLDTHIQKMRLKNAAIERRQREIQLDKERYG